MFDHRNLLLNTDSYKHSHFRQYPPNTTRVFSYIEARGGMTSTVFFGLQGFLLEYLQGAIVNIDRMREAALICQHHGVPFNLEGWERLLNKHFGMLPLHIRAVPEGTIVPTGNALVTVENTDPEFPWLTSFIETALLRAVWYPTTVATISKQCRSLIERAIALSSDEPGQIDFKLHDFGARGVSSLESAAIGGAAHLVNFKGTDTMSGLLYARNFYGAGMAGFSIPAAEHSTITSWGKLHEVDAYRNMIDQFGAGTYAVVSDSYDLRNAVDNIWGKELKDAVLAAPGTLVVRPDSGDPCLVPVEVISQLGESFGFTVNSKGYKVLNKVRVIQGDGITIHSIDKIIVSLLSAGWAIDNLAFGMGGGLLQQVNRDTCKFAMKCSAIEVDGSWRDVFKEPKTDLGKTSKRGRLDLVRDVGGYRTTTFDETVYLGSELETVFLDGEVKRFQNFEDVRARAAASA